MKQVAKQQLLIEYLLSSADTFALCKSILKADYFDPEYRKAVEFLGEYYDKYSSLPSPEQVYAEAGLTVSKHQITRDQLKYTTDQIETFCQQQALIHAILKCPDLIDKKDYGKVQQLIKEASTVSLNRDLGLDYFDDPLTRLEEQSMQPLREPMGFEPLDELMSGGMAKTEIILFCANSGGGKSITLANLAYNYVARGKNVLYLSLELSEALIAQRFDIMYTGIPSVKMNDEYEKVAQQINQANKDGLGKLMIKWMRSGTNANEIRAYLKEFELQYGFVPDVLIVDYLDLMNPNEKIDLTEIWTKDKLSTEQLKDVGADYGFIIATASQLNRSAIEAEELNQGHTAGGISKVNTVDWQWAIVHTPAMKAAGDIMFICLKSRSSDAVGKSVYMIWDNRFLRILNPKKNGDDDDGGALRRAVEDKKTMKGLPKKTGRSLLDIVDS